MDDRELEPVGVGRLDLVQVADPGDVLDGSRGDAPADVALHDRVPELEPEDAGRVDPRVDAGDDVHLPVGDEGDRRHPVLEIRPGEGLVALQQLVEVSHKENVARGRDHRQAAERPDIARIPPTRAAAERGTDAAIRVVRRMVVAPHRDDGQAKWLERPVPLPGHGLVATCEWVEAIARRSGLGSPANLRVHLARDAGATPTAYRAAYQGRTTKARAPRS